ncbi:unnamed protein product [Notodromas monacha]|uniref:Uncharacterized protein n=1 Tax=Notodromas monacha TaxID=399045 RepID=A0A7R9GJ65_9CRUS|nr:unnamed protein product [Notodromas monacha]CAG0923317.1 unnamed protein product [Notodromas monacha]
MKGQDKEFDNPAYQVDVEQGSSISGPVTSDETEAVNIELVNAGDNRRVGFESESSDGYFMARSVSGAKSFYPLTDEDDEKVARRRRLLLLVLFFVAVGGLGVLIGAMIGDGSEDEKSQEGLGATSGALVAPRDGRGLLLNDIWPDEETPEDKDMVRGALEGEFMITNYRFSKKLLDTTTQGFKLTKMLLEEALVNGLADSARLSVDEKRHFNVKIIEFFDGSFGCKLRMSWKAPEGAKPLFTPDLVKSYLIYHLTLNQGMLGPYLIQKSSIHFSYFKDVCASGRGECSHWCRFSTKRLVFKCMCPTDMHLGEDGINCVRGPGPVDSEDSDESPASAEPEPQNRPEHSQVSNSNEVIFSTDDDEDYDDESGLTLYRPDGEDEQEEAEDKHKSVITTSLPELPQMPWDLPEGVSPADLGFSVHSDDHAHEEPDVAPEPSPVLPRGKAGKSFDPLGSMTKSGEPAPEPVSVGVPEPVGEPAPSSEPEPEAVGSTSEPKAEPSNIEKVGLPQPEPSFKEVAGSPEPEPVQKQSHEPVNVSPEPQPESEPSAKPDAGSPEPKPEPVNKEAPVLGSLEPRNPPESLPEPEPMSTPEPEPK